MFLVNFFLYFVQGGKSKKMNELQLPDKKFDLSWSFHGNSILNAPVAPTRRKLISSYLISRQCQNLRASLIAGEVETFLCADLCEKNLHELRESFSCTAKLLE